MKKIVFASLFFRGLLSIIAQVILIRELLITFLGNELSIGIILANWLLLGALGSYISGRITSRIKNKVPVFIILVIVISLYLPVAVFLSRAIKTLLGVGVGEVVGIPLIFISSLAVLSLLPFCDGALFSLGCSIYSEIKKRDFSSIARVFILESLGFVIGGLLFSLLLIRYFGSFEIVFLLAFTNLIIALLLSLSQKSFLRLSIPILIFLLLFGCLSLNPRLLQEASLKIQWKGLDVLDYQNSIYGNVMVTKRLNEFTFFYDGTPLLTSPNPDIISVEDLSHFSLLSHPAPSKVLVIGGASGGLINEILKHPINLIDYAELDPLIIKMVKKFSTELTTQELTNPKVHIHYIDARLFIKRNQPDYDIIIVNLPSPSTLQLNRFYTQEFFSQAKRVLRKDGILVIKLPGSLSYLSKEIRQLNNCIYQTLNKVFKDIKVIPGDTNLYLTSDGGLRDFRIESLIQRFKQRKIASRLFTEFYIRERLDRRWQDWFFSELNPEEKTKINTDLQGSGLFYEISFLNAQFSPRLNTIFNWLEKVRFKFIIIILILLNFVIAIFRRFFRLKNFVFNFAIFSTGFMGMSINLILVFAFQSFYGYLYYQITILVAAFMLGLTLGSIFITKILRRSQNDQLCILKIESAIIIFCIIVGSGLFTLNRFLAFEKLKIIFPLLCGLCGSLVGMEFPMVNKIRLSNEKSLGKVGGSLYAWDLLGSCLGALSVSIFLIPVLGIIQTIALIALLKITSLNLITA